MPIYRLSIIFFDIIAHPYLLVMFVTKASIGWDTIQVINSIPWVHGAFGNVFDDKLIERGFVLC